MPESQHGRTDKASPLRVALLIVSALVVAGGAVTAAVVLTASSSGTPGAAGSSSTTSAPGTSATATTTGSTTTGTSAAQPQSSFRVTAVSPAAGSARVSGTAQLTVSFSADVAPASPMPQLFPPEAGTWHASGSQLVFSPSIPYLPLTLVELLVPGGPGGVEAASGARLAIAFEAKFQVADGSTLRLQQLLSQLDYSPLTFVPSGAAISPTDLTAEVTALYDPPSGTFAWRQHGWPSQLTSLWQAGSYNVMTKGLVMEFQADHGLVTSGQTSTALWQALLTALAAGTGNTGGYNYALTDKHQPESLTIWHDGTVVVRVPANTGIAVDPTVDGNFNVYARYRNEIMRGTNPDGSKYADPVQYVAYFNGGDAVHYIPRADYGIPQSLGCVELNLADAAKAWPYLAYGTVVSVIG